MFGAFLKATNSSFRKGMTFCRSIYVKKVMKLLAFIFEQPSYLRQFIQSILTCIQNYISRQHMRFRFVSQRRAANTQASVWKCIESPEPSQLAYIDYRSR